MGGEFVSRLDVLNMGALRAEAAALTEDGDFDGADHAYRMALDAPASIGAEYGRIFMEWARSSEQQHRVTGNPEALSLALARAARGLVILEQDEHRVVREAELDQAQRTKLRIADALADAQTLAEASHTAAPLQLVA